MEYVNLTVKVEKSMHKRFKLLAIENGWTMAELIVNSIDAYIDDPYAKPTKPTKKGKKA